MTILNRDNNLKTLKASENCYIIVEEGVYSDEVLLSKDLSLLSDKELQSKFKEITEEEKTALEKEAQEKGEEENDDK